MVDPINPPMVQVDPNDANSDSVINTYCTRKLEKFFNDDDSIQTAGIDDAIIQGANL